MSAITAGPPVERSEERIGLLRWFAGTAAGLMLVGLLARLTGGPHGLPGEQAVPPARLAATLATDWPEVAMSAVMLLLALLPTYRVAAILWQWLTRRVWLEAAVAALVLAELLGSLHAG